MSQEPAVTTSQRIQEANLFNVTGPIAISYSRDSITGEHQFFYKDGELELSFSGNDIAREDTLLGEIVTITLKIAVDAFVRTFTLLVPKIRIRMGDQVSFDALGIEMINRSGAFVPPPGPTGVLQTYRSHQLQGVAEAVISFSP